jgi:hypothetical protein
MRLLVSSGSETGQVTAIVTKVMNLVVTKMAEKTCWINEKLACRHDESVNIFMGPNSVYETGTRGLYNVQIGHV